MYKILHSRKPVWEQSLRRGFLILGVLGLVYGCGSSANLVNMWRDPSFQRGPMKTMLIVGVYKNPVARRLWEDGFVAELSENGTTATPSYQLFPNAVPDTAHIAEAMRARGYDGVLITRRLPTQVITNYVPGYVTTVPVTRYNWWTDAYHTYYQEVYQPGYWSVNVRTNGCHSEPECNGGEESLLIRKTRCFGRLRPQHDNSSKLP